MKKQNILRCIVYLSVKGEMRNIVRKEERQLRYIGEYARANKIEIVGVIHRGGLGQYEANRQFNMIIHEIAIKHYDGVLLANMASVAKGISDAYVKIGKIVETGGHVITVDEGDLKLSLKM